MYSLGTKSDGRLNGGQPEIQDVVRLAIQITEQDFSVLEVMRTKTKQRSNIKKGVSKTMNSRHLTGHAVDLIPYNGRGKDIDWNDWSKFYAIADAMREAARRLGVVLVWGGSWTRIDNTTASMEELMRQYVNRKRRQGKKAFTDGPHFELSWKHYPI